MRAHRKRKLKITNIILFFLLILIIVILISKLPKKDTSSKEILMDNIIGNNINEVLDKLKEYHLDINTEYQYDDKLPKDSIISQSINPETILNEGDKLTLIVSLGKLDKDKLKSDTINELGKVPIMMYHGIKNISNSETPNTGGNVDKDGYTRTVEAFRNDLDFYYENGYRMLSLTDYINGNIATEYGKSPIVITFDDGNDNNILVTGLDSEGNIIIDPNSAVGVLEEYKKKYPDFNVTATFFVTDALFNQPTYNDKILHWLVDNGYEVGNHTKNHNDLRKTTESQTEEVIGYMYNKLENILGNKYSKTIALPFGSPYNKEHPNYKYVISGQYNSKEYHSIGALRVGWEPEVSPYNKDFDPLFLKRCRAYDNNGVEFDIEMVFKMLKNTRYISDGNKDTIVTSKKNELIIGNNEKELILYE